MLPIVWVYIAGVVFLWGLLLYTEVKKRARAHVKGCSLLPHISPERLNSLIIIEPDLKIVELNSHGRTAGIPDALQIPVDELEDFLRHVSSSTVVVLYASAVNPVNWKQSQRQVEHSSVRNVFVLCGGLEAWLNWKNTSALLGSY